MYTVIVLGKQGAGKSHLIHAMGKGDFNALSTSPLLLTNKETNSNLLIMEQSEGNYNYTDASICIVCYDVTDMNSFYHAFTTATEIKKNRANVPTLLVGTKTDLMRNNKISVSASLANQLAERDGYIFAGEVSAKNSTSTQLLLDSLYSIFKSELKKRKDDIENRLLQHNLDTNGQGLVAGNGEVCWNTGANVIKINVLLNQGMERQYLKDILAILDDYKFVEIENLGSNSNNQLTSLYRFSFKGQPLGINAAEVHAKIAQLQASMKVNNNNTPTIVTLNTQNNNNVCNNTIPQNAVSNMVNAGLNFHTAPDKQASENTNSLTEEKQLKF